MLTDEILTIIIPGEVVPKQSVRVRAIPFYNEKKDKWDAFIKTYQHKKIVDFEKTVANTARAQLGELFTPISGAISMSVTIITKILKSMPKKDHEYIAQGGIIYKTTQPDLTDNMVKGVIDGLHDVLFTNDGQICKFKSQKIYGLEPKIIIKAKEISDRTNPNTII